MIYIFLSLASWNNLYYLYTKIIIIDISLRDNVC